MHCITLLLLSVRNFPILEQDIFQYIVDTQRASKTHVNIDGLENTVKSLYNMPRYNTDFSITWSCCGSQIYYHRFNKGIFLLLENDHKMEL